MPKFFDLTQLDANRDSKLSLATAPQSLQPTLPSLSPDEKQSFDWFQVSHDFNIMGNEHKQFIEQTKKDAETRRLKLEEQIQAQREENERVI